MKNGKYPRYTPILKVREGNRRPRRWRDRLAWPFLVSRSGTWRSQRDLDVFEETLLLNDRLP
jgi:hypothetical protein